MAANDDYDIEEALNARLADEEREASVFAYEERMARRSDDYGPCDN